MNRRQLLSSAVAAVTGGMGGGDALAFLGTASAASSLVASNDYRALVCVFLAGGNDGTNTLIRNDPSGYSAYAGRRGALALPRASLLPLSAGGLDASYALHPAAGALQRMFDAGSLAFVANDGTLLAPTTLGDYRAERNLPPHLFSHIDQKNQWASPAADARTADGWAGRLAEVLSTSNSGGVVPINIGIDQASRWQSSSSQPGFVVNSRRIARLAATTNAPTSARSTTYRRLQEQAVSGASGLTRVWGDVGVRAIDLSSALYAASTAVPALTTPVPDDDFSRGLAMIVRLVSMRSLLGARRQTFFIELGGFDTHENHLEEHQILMERLSSGLGYLEEALKEAGAWDSVTTFTMSDFGRTTVPNRTGLDHGWGSHHLIMGGSVNGGAVYGRIPDLRQGSETDLSAGRLLPTTAADQYSATLSAWMGLSGDLLATAHPRLSRFPAANLGFMKG